MNKFKLTVRIRIKTETNIWVAEDRVFIIEAGCHSSAIANLNYFFDTSTQYGKDEIQILDCTAL